ncbi:MAG: sulfatase-like hydrolase/transferase [Candidatus Sumerlaeota bacterium]|nr:sulfatase-like hydrolase/transferase [Candidatus Sumerlaeota bacterium]
MPCSRREFLKRMSMTAAAWTLGRSRGMGAAARKPNILMIVSDEETQLPAADRAIIEAPNKAWLEQRGVRFTRFFCTSPQCTPARSSIQSGLYPHQTNHVANTNKPWGGPFSPGTEFLGVNMAKAGYRAGYGGKWHLYNKMDELGYEWVKQTKDDGKESVLFRDFLAKDDERPWFYQAHYINPHDIYSFTPLFEGGPAGGEDGGGGESVDAKESKRQDPTAEYKKRALDIRRRHPELALQPGWSQPIRDLPKAIGGWALPFQDDGRYAKMTEAEKRDYWLNYKALYLALFEFLDRDVGALLDVLRVEKADLLENTIIVYTADHGDMAATHDVLKYKGPLEFESLLNIPLLISGPGIPANQERAQLTSQVDLPYTLCDLGGAAAPNQGKSDARSLAPILRDPSAPGRDYVFCEYHYLGGLQPLRVIRSDRCKYAVHLAEKKTVLFNLERDPYETNNLSGTPECAEIEANLAANLKKWQEETNDPLRDGKIEYEPWRRAPKSAPPTGNQKAKKAKNAKSAKAKSAP